jgi:hypothetical protein
VGTSASRAAPLFSDDVAQWNASLAQELGLTRTRWTFCAKGFRLFRVYRVFRGYRGYRVSKGFKGVGGFGGFASFRFQIFFPML